MYYIIISKNIYCNNNDITINYSSSYNKLRKTILVEIIFDSMLL